MACETLRSYAKRLGVLAVTTLPGASRSFDPRPWTEMNVGLDWVGFNPDYTHFFDILIRSGLSIVSKICDLDRIWTE